MGRKVGIWMYQNGDGEKIAKERLDVKDMKRESELKTHYTGIKY